MIKIYYNDTDLWNYILFDVDKSIYSKHKVHLNKHIVLRLLRKFLGRKIRYLPFLARYIFPNDLYDNLKNVCADDTILVLDRVLPSELWAIAKTVPKDCDKILWYWNPLCKTYAYKDIESNIAFIKSLGYKIYTFDQYDVDIYKLLYHNQVGRIQPVNEEINIEYDFYFIGRVKDRYEVIREIESYLCACGYNNQFIYVTDKSQFISYDANINNVKHCKCVIDVNQKPQCGVTLRPIEALFYKKKLITNNYNIKSYDFYSPNNIFIWGEDSVANLNTFLQSPYEDVDENIVYKYDIKEWLRALCERK